MWRDGLTLGIVAVLGAGLAPSTAAAFATVPVPRQVVAFAEAGSAVHLSWRYDGPPLRGFAIFRRTTLADGWQRIAVLPKDVRHFESTGLLGEQTVDHCVAVVAANGPGPCIASNPARTAAPYKSARGRVIAPRSVQYPRDGEGSVAGTASNLLFVYGRYEGTGDYANASLALRTSTDGGKSWSAERLLFADARQLALPSLTSLPGGELVLSYVEILDKAHAKRVIRRSADGGRTWDEPVDVTDGIRPYMTGSHDRLRRLSNGRLIYPVHALMREGDLATFVYVSDDEGRSWRRTTPRPLRVASVAYPDSFGRGFWEASIAETAPGRLLMVARTAMGRLYRSQSDDFGESWSSPVPMPVLAPTAPANIVQLSSLGATLLVWEPHVAKEAGGGFRLVLGSLLSRDAGRTWGDYHQIEYTGLDWFSYPSLFADASNTVHLTYYGENDAAGDTNGHGNAFGGGRYLAIPADWFGKASEAR